MKHIRELALALAGSPPAALHEQTGKKSGTVFLNKHYKNTAGGFTQVNETVTATKWGTWAALHGDMAHKPQNLGRRPVLTTSTRRQATEVAP